MNTLKPGYIPEGWTPGEHVHVVEPQKPGTFGMVVHAPKGLEHALMVTATPRTVAAIRWRFEDMEEVAHWLEWWRSFRGLKVTKVVH